MKKDDKILVTGGHGFLGGYVVDKLRSEGYEKIWTPKHSDYDLIRESDVSRLYRDLKPDIVLHLAAEVGGIGANRENPGRFFFANMSMGMSLIEGARIHGVKKFLQMGTICAYPKFAPIPFNEADLWKGFPDETNAPYGIAKKALLVMCRAYRQQYGLNAIYLLPVNLYGPRDNFAPRTSHVIPALIRKCVDARKNGAPEITVWGSGKASREFLYVEDCAEAVVLAAQKYNSSEPVNIGTGREVTIHDLVHKIAELTGFKGKILWDNTEPDGQPRRRLDVSRAQKELGFIAKTPFETGLARTVEWYEKILARDGCRSAGFKPLGAQLPYPS